MLLLPFISGGQLDLVETTRAVAAAPLYALMVGVTMPSPVDLPWINLLFS